MIGLYVSLLDHIAHRKLITRFSCVTFGLMAAAFVPMLFLVNSTPDRIPADVVLEGKEVEEKKMIETDVVEPKFA